MTTILILKDKKQSNMIVNYINNNSLDIKISYIYESLVEAIDELKSLPIYVDKIIFDTLSVDGKTATINNKILNTFSDLLEKENINYAELICLGFNDDEKKDLINLNFSDNEKFNFYFNEFYNTQIYINYINNKLKTKDLGDISLKYTNVYEIKKGEEIKEYEAFSVNVSNKPVLIDDEEKINDYITRLKRQSDLKDANIKPFVQSVQIPDIDIKTFDFKDEDIEVINVAENSNKNKCKIFCVTGERRSGVSSFALALANSCLASDLSKKFLLIDADYHSLGLSFKAIQIKCNSAFFYFGDLVSKQKYLNQIKNNNFKMNIISLRKSMQEEYSEIDFFTTLEFYITYFKLSGIYDKIIIDLPLNYIKNCTKLLFDIDQIIVTVPCWLNNFVSTASALKSENIDSSLKKNLIIVPTSLFKEIKDIKKVSYELMKEKFEDINDINNFMTGTVDFKSLKIDNTLFDGIYKIMENNQSKIWK